jgi:hypothetical protein
LSHIMLEDEHKHQLYKIPVNVTSYPSRKEQGGSCLSPH